MRKLMIMLLVFALAATGILAQEDETFTTDNFSVTVPAGWVVESAEGQVLIATSEGALGNVTAGEAGVTILLPESLAAFGLDMEVDPVVVVETLIDLLGDETTEFGEVETFDMPNGTPGAQVTITDNSTFEGYLAALLFEEGMVVAAFETAPGEFESFVDDFAAIGESIQYGSDIMTEDSNTFTADGFSIMLPDGWVTQEEEGQILLASSEGALGNVSEGEASVTILLPESLAAFALDTETDPVVVVESIIELLADDTTEFSPVQAFEQEKGNPAARASITDNDTFEGLLAAVAFEDGVIVVAFETSVGNLETYLDTFVALGESIEYGSSMEASDDLLRQWASNATGTSEYGNPNWGFIQATGEPDTTVCGDETTAWASESSTGSDILVLEYEELVQPTEINIYQTYNPGAIIFVEVANNTEEDAETYTLPNSEDPLGNTDCPGVFTIEITEELPPINTVIIYLDQTLTGSWNEIDAVELVGVPVDDE